MTTVRHVTSVRPAFDCMTGNCSVPDCPGYPRGDGRSHGIGSERRFCGAVVDHHTGQVAVSFTYGTGIYHETTPAWKHSAPMAFDLGFHSTVALYPDQWRSDACEYMADGGPCYYDGSGLAADAFLSILLADGEDALWAAMDARLVEFVAELEASIRERGGVVR